MPENPTVIKSFVTTNLVDVVSAKYGAKTVNVLTGFKYIGEYITALEAKGKADDFIVGMEESYGYLSGIHARDKDAVVASALICEMAAYHKSHGKGLYEVMEDIYTENGFFLNSLGNFVFEGAAGMQKMAEIMDELRKNPPEKIGGMEVLGIDDYLLSESLDLKSGEKKEITLPKSNVLSYKLPGSCGLIVRPSGTEPKIKCYYTAVASTRDDAAKIVELLDKDMKDIMR